LVIAVAVLRIDNPEKTARLLAALNEAMPFKVELAPSLVSYLRTQHVAIADQTEHTVSDLSYAGAEGGIVCRIVPSEGREALAVSLTHQPSLANRTTSLWAAYEPQPLPLDFRCIACNSSNISTLLCGFALS
jgi:hypothetical protein